jgi:2-hydroxychromene-2-carboxylate isomerase
MATTTIDYFFSPVSPWSYLGHQRFTEMAARYAAKINVKPVDYGKVFPASGGLPLKQRAAQRQAYRLLELRRFREHLGVPLNLEPRFFPTPAEAASLFIIAADQRHGSDAALRLAHAFMRACWTEERNIADGATLQDICASQGIDAGALAVADGKAAAAYQAYTQEAIDRQVFGAPTYIVDDEPFWGQDRLEFVERALAKSASRTATS